MWEAIKEILTSPYSIITLGFILVLIVVGIILARKGLLSIKTKSVTIGLRESERQIIRSQMMFVDSAIEEFYDKIPKFEGRNEYQLKYICELVIDSYYKAIALNHISKDPVYRGIKKGEVLKIILSNTNNAAFRDDHFKCEVEKEVDRVYDSLIEIREYETKNVH